MRKLYLFNRSLHRDIGYLCVGLILVYAVSGIALNHLHDWNPNYKKVHEAVDLQSFAIKNSLGDIDEVKTAESVLRELQINEKFRSTFQPSPDELKIFLEEGVVKVDFNKRKVDYEIVKERFLFFQINAIHLNKVHSAWKWLADIFSVLLIYLAISGLFMVKGKFSALNRGAKFVTIGFIVPIIGIVLLVYFN